jgi:hypothetical protein
MLGLSEMFILTSPTLGLHLMNLVVWRGTIKVQDSGHASGIKLYQFLTPEKLSIFAKMDKTRAKEYFGKDEHLTDFDYAELQRLYAEYEKENQADKFSKITLLAVLYCAETNSCRAYPVFQMRYIWPLSS